MLQKLNLTNTRSVLFEKANKHSCFLKNMIDILDGVYYFQWPEYPDIVLFYKGDKCILQIDNWFQICSLDYNIAKDFFTNDYKLVSNQEIAGKILNKILNLSSQYHFSIHTALPTATKSFVRGSVPTEEEEKRNQRYADIKNLSFDEQILHAAGIKSRLDDYRTDLLRSLLYKRILARH